jgi:hypothetical protein
LDTTTREAIELQRKAMKSAAAYAGILRIWRLRFVGVSTSPLDIVLVISAT